MSNTSNFFQNSANQESSNLKGNVTSKIVNPLWDASCKTGCISTWEDQENQETEESYWEYERHQEEYERQEQEEELEEGEIAEPKEERMKQCYLNQLERDAIDFANMAYEELVRQEEEREQRDSGFFFGIVPCDTEYFNTCDEF
jgi:hypothetical protein